MGAYAVGLGVPFLLTALFLDRATSLMAADAAEHGGGERVTGALLVAVGLMMLTGGLSGAVLLAARHVSGAGDDRLIRPPAG